MRLHVAMLICATVSCGCGGGDQEAKKAAVAPTFELITTFSLSPEHQANSAKGSAVFPAYLLNRAAAPASPASQPVATSEEPELTLEDESGKKSTEFALRPIHGRGYADLKIVLMARKIGESSPPQPVRPTCREKCTYALSRTYTVAVSDEKLVKLTPRDEGLALSARVMSVETPRAVEIIFSDDGHVIGKRRVVLLSE